MLQALGRVSRPAAIAVAKEAAGHFFGPLAMVARPLGTELLKALKDDKSAFSWSPPASPTEKQRRRWRNLRQMAGYTALLSYLMPATRQYATIPMHEFDQQLRALLNPNPKCVLSFASLPDPTTKFYPLSRDGINEQRVSDQVLWAESNDRFQRFYSGHSDARLIRVENLKGLVAQFKQLHSEGKACDRIEISLHGSPTKIGFADGSTATAEQIREAFSQDAPSIALPGAELVLISCGTSGQTGSIQPEKDVMVALTENTLTLGGRSFSSPRNIAVSTVDEGSTRYILPGLLYMTGFANAFYGKKVIFAPTKLDGTLREDIHVRDIPAR